MLMLNNIFILYNDNLVHIQTMRRTQL